MTTSEKGYRYMIAMISLPSSPGIIVDVRYPSHVQLEYPRLLRADKEIKEGTGILRVLSFFLSFK